MKLRSTDQELRDEAEALAHVGSFVIDFGPTSTSRWSAECRRILGVTVDAPGSREAFWSLVHPEDRERVAAERDAALVARVPYDVTFRIRRASDGEIRWVQSRARPTLDEAGVVVGLVGVVLDIHAKRIACDELRTSN
ncbi:MAG TPA: PAS domain-containing protein, partial [Polyangiaceae bacterium]